MAEKFTWIVFRAHPSRLNEGSDSSPDFFGTFVCPVSRSEPEELLRELLSTRGLFLVHITNTEMKKETDYWGLYERLRTEVAQQGYGIALMRTVPRPIALQ